MKLAPLDKFYLLSLALIMLLLIAVIGLGAGNLSLIKRNASSIERLVGLHESEAEEKK